MITSTFSRNTAGLRPREEAEMRATGRGGAKTRTSVCERHGEYRAYNFLADITPDVWTGCPACAEERRGESERARLEKEGAAASRVKTRASVCERHGEYRAYNFLSTRPDLWTGCPACAEEARERELEGERAARLEAGRAYYSDDFEAMNIREMYYEATFESFVAESEELRRNRDAARRFCDEGGSGRRKLFLIGGRGTGKTRLARAVVRRFRGVIHTMFEITLPLKNTYDGGGGRTENDVLERLLAARPLAIDEIGGTKKSEWESNCLSHIINTRRERYLPTPLVSDGHFKSGREKGGRKKCLDECLGDNVLSRLAEDCEFLSFYGEDFRKKNRMARSGDM
jgi:DNA replication protein DnaC